MRKEELAIIVNAYDAGCLPGSLERCIAQAEAQKRGTQQLSAEQAGMMDEYIRQLNNCLKAVHAARTKWVTGSCSQSPADRAPPHE